MKRRAAQLSDSANARTVGLIRQLRDERGMTQVELARALRMTQPGVSNLLSGRQRASLAVAQHVAEVAGVPLAELLDGHGAIVLPALNLPPSTSLGAGAAARKSYQLSDAANARTVAMLRQLRDREGLTQAALAEAIGADQPTVSSLLAGQKRASYPLAKGVADYAGIAITELLGDEFAPRQGDALVSMVRTAPIDAVRAMGDAEGFDRAWVARWAPRGGLGVPYTADELWALMKADYSRFGAREAPVSAEVREERALVDRLAELVERLKSSLEGERAAQPAERNRRKA